MVDGPAANSVMVGVFPELESNARVMERSGKRLLSNGQSLRSVMRLDNPRMRNCSVGNPIFPQRGNERRGQKLIVATPFGDSASDFHFYPSPIRNILVSQVGQVPCVAGLPVFRVT